MPLVLPGLKSPLTIETGNWREERLVLPLCLFFSTPDKVSRPFWVWEEISFFLHWGISCQNEEFSQRVVVPNAAMNLQGETAGSQPENIWDLPVSNHPRSEHRWCVRKLTVLMDITTSEAFNKQRGRGHWKDLIAKIDTCNPFPLCLTAGAVTWINQWG